MTVLLCTSNILSVRALWKNKVMVLTPFTVESAHLVMRIQVDESVFPVDNNNSLAEFQDHVRRVL